MSIRQPRLSATLNRFLEVLRRAEGDLLTCFDLYRFPGRRVAPHARRVFADLKDAEASDPDAVRNPTAFLRRPKI